MFLLSLFLFLVVDYCPLLIAYPFAIEVRNWRVELLPFFRVSLEKGGGENRGGSRSRAIFIEFRSLELAPRVTSDRIRDRIREGVVAAFNRRFFFFCK